MKNLLKSLFIASAMFSVASASAISDPYAVIRDLPEQPYYFEDAWIVQNLATTHSAQVLIDLGSVDGGAARYFAQNLPGTKVYSISSWNDYDVTDPGSSYGFHKFLSNVKHEGLTEIIVPIRMDSLEGADSLNILADLIYINSGDYSVYDTVSAWLSHLSTNGVIAGNNWRLHDVQRGVVDVAAELELTLNLSDNIWWLTR